MSFDLAGITIPETIATETVGIVGQKGSGKTFTGRVLTERMYHEGLPVCVIDPLGVWHGLRSSADGKSEGLAFTILGGDHGDVPLEDTAGEVVADFVVDTGGWSVIDLSLFRKAAMRRFMTGFLGKLYHRNRDPLHLMVDEADMFAPQRPPKDGIALLGAMEDTVRRGRARGLGMTMITQRPAVIAKDVLTQIGTLVCHRLTSPQDRAAADTWVTAHGSKEQRAEMMESLAGLDTGTCWLWSPQWLDAFAKLEIPMAETFDSSATPKQGKRPEPKVTRELDLASLQEAMADTIERAKANDPKALKAEVTKLRKQLADAESHIETREVEVEVVREVVPKKVSEQLRHIFRQADTMQSIATDCFQASYEIFELIEQMDEAPKRTPTRTPARTKQAAKSTKSQVSRSSRGDTNRDEKLGKAERSVLTVLAQLGDKSLTQLALLTGYASSGGAFRNALSSLRTKGYLEGSNQEIMTITDEGLDALGDFEQLPHGQDLRDWWASRLGKAERLVFEHLCDIWPDGDVLENIAEVTGYEPTGGAFRNALSSLRTRELIVGSNQEAMQASNHLFEEG